jgi:quercetin 2,3-dioxygenase
MARTKQLSHVIRNVLPHWVGDGFPVRSLFSYRGDAAATDPFLLLDYAEPYEFPPAPAHRGVEEHPHRGFETVTIVFQGELEHRDSAGNSGSIGPGDVQWMTAASGVVHEEFHSAAFTARGGTFEVVQLWVNLPAKLKMSPPRYQEIRAAQIPVVPLAGGAGTARIIAGELGGTRGPAQTFTPVNLWNLELSAGKSVELPVPDGQTTMLAVRHGRVIVEGEPVSGGEVAQWERGGDAILLDVTEDAAGLLLAGQPIGEPIAAQGPFVMNTTGEIRQAIADFQSGRMGSLS